MATAIQSTVEVNAVFSRGYHTDNNPVMKVARCIDVLPDSKCLTGNLLGTDNYIFVIGSGRFQIDYVAEPFDASIPLAISKRAISTYGKMTVSILSVASQTSYILSLTMFPYLRFLSRYSFVLGWKKKTPPIQ